MQNWQPHCSNVVDSAKLSTSMRHSLQVNCWKLMGVAGVPAVGSVMPSRTQQACADWLALAMDSSELTVKGYAFVVPKGPCSPLAMLLFGVANGCCSSGSSMVTPLLLLMLLLLLLECNVAVVTLDGGLGLLALWTPLELLRDPQLLPLLSRICALTLMCGSGIGSEVGSAEPPAGPSAKLTLGLLWFDVLSDSAESGRGTNPLASE